MSKGFQSEADMCRHFVEWLRPRVARIAFEVDGAMDRRHDIVAIDGGGNVLVIEAKVGMCLDLLHAAVDAISPARTSSPSANGAAVVCVPRFRTLDRDRKLCAAMGIGLYYVQRREQEYCWRTQKTLPDRVEVSEVVTPVLKGTPLAARWATRFDNAELGDAEPGNAAGQRNSAAVATWKRVRALLAEKGRATPAEIVEAVQHHYSSKSVFKAELAKRAPDGGWNVLAPWLDCDGTGKARVYRLKEVA